VGFDAVKNSERGAARVAEAGLMLDVRGTALIAQATRRIAWHKHNAALMASELRNLPPRDGKLASADEWKQDARRTELTRLMRGHEEHARYLGFLKQHVNRRRTYRLSLQDLSHLEITPKGSHS
jgi:hypothetical protein